MKKYLVFILLITLVFTSYIFIKANENQKRSEVLKFSHRIHVKDAEIACIDCHTNVENSVNADDKNFPGKEVCQSCHDVEDDENCTLCHIDMDNLESFANPVRNYYFNHKKHLADDKVTCDKCHPGMEDIDMGAGRKIPSQDNCNSCHDGLNATMECFTCHSEQTKFHPDSHSPTWSREHMVQVRAGGSDCAHCHTNNYCQGCHESTDLISTKILAKDYYTPYSPQAAGKQSLVLKSVHDLNYRFIHQLDASGKEKKCSTCHETSSYCSECHSNSSNSLVRPAWHGGPDWGALLIGIGTGGGRHAELARRDIENCAACHEVQGADPACLQCHADYDGIKNTDPKTHESGFSNRFGEGSIFHSDEGAMCFTCHTNTRRAGVGFCGYCHGSK